eukprot:GHVP01068162.1.p1 GENE.GHVP01068162.1~~GHVP01068162.1.p1  ORF type:complete len:316 (-),score=39.72 GHVP01068162.1:287-1234(-)
MPAPTNKRMPAPGNINGINEIMSEMTHQQQILEEVSGFDARLIIMKFLEKLLGKKKASHDDLQNLILLLAIGVAGGTSRKAILRSKNHVKAEALFTELGVEFPTRGQVVDIKKNSLTMSRLLAIHPLLCFIVQNIDEANEKYNNLSYGLPNFLASRALIFMASVLGFKEEHQRWYLSWLEDINRFAKFLLIDAVREQHNASCTKNEDILEYNSLFLPIASKFDFTKDNHFFLSMIFRKFENLPVNERKEISKDEMNWIRNSINGITGPSFDSEIITRHMNRKQGREIENFAKIRVSRYDSDSLFSSLIGSPKRAE